MAPKFVQPAFIRRNNPYLRKKLEELGYNVLFSARNGLGRWLVTTECGFVHTMHTDIGRFIDCGENDDLFLAIAALREDSDRFQWFCDDNDLWEMTESDLPSRYMQMHGHKASVAEIIKFFKEQ